MNHHDSKMRALQDQFDAAERDAKNAGPGLAGILDVAKSLGVMGDAFGQMRKLTAKKAGESHENP